MPHRPSESGEVGDESKGPAVEEVFDPREFIEPVREFVSNSPAFVWPTASQDAAQDPRFLCWKTKKNVATWAAELTLK